MDLVTRAKVDIAEFRRLVNECPDFARVYFGDTFTIIEKQLKILEATMARKPVPDDPEEVEKSLGYLEESLMDMAAFMRQAKGMKEAVD